MNEELHTIAKGIASGELFATSEVLERVRHLLCIVPHKIIRLHVDGDGSHLVAVCQQYDYSPQKSLIWDSAEAKEGLSQRGYQILPLPVPHYSCRQQYKPKRTSLISRLRAAWAALMGRHADE